jgi:hypothetical protein
LLNNHKEQGYEQKDKLENQFEEGRNNIEQIDDTMVIGIRFSDNVIRTL